MIEQKMRSALLFLAGSLLAAGAWGQEVKFVQSTVGKVTVAEEYFGTGAAGRQVSFVGDNGDKQPMVVVQILPDEGNNLGERNEADLTFRLNGATFVSAVTVNSLGYYTNPSANPFGEDPDATPTANPVDVESSDISWSVEDGGATGDNWVTFRLRVERANVIDVSGTDLRFFGFELPPLQVSPATLGATSKGVAVTAELLSVVNRSSAFPSAVHGLATPTAERPATGGIVPVVAALDGLVLDTAAAMTTTLSNEGAATVSLSNRKVIAGTGAGAGVEVTRPNGEKAHGMLIGRVEVELGSGSIKALTPDDPVVAGTRVHGSLSGDLIVEVSGRRFQTDDMVFLNKNQQAVDGDGVFVRGEGEKVARLELTLGRIAPMDIIYVPGGVEDLRPAEFTATARVDFNDKRNKGGAVTGQEATGTLSYQGVSPAAYAYGVIRADDEAATSFLMVTCDSSGGCSVFLDCTGEDGTSYFNQIAASPGSADIPSGATEVFTSNEIAEALPGDGWERGHGRCDLLSNGDLQVQHMIRTSGNALHNNSVVIGQGHTITESIGLLGGRGTHLPGSVMVPTLAAGQQLFRLPSGELYGTYMVINSLADALGSESVALMASDGCGTIAVDKDVTVTATTTTPPCTTPDGAVPLMSGDIVYPAAFSYGVYRPARRDYVPKAAPVATSTAPALDDS